MECRDKCVQDRDEGMAMGQQILGEATLMYCHGAMQSRVDKAPKVYCPREGRDVPVWWCIGSYVQGKGTCKELIKAKDSTDFADVDCVPRNFALLKMRRQR